MQHKAILTTVFSGYNYGSSLQAFASKAILQEMGYDCQLVALKSLVDGRDIRFGKLITILTRSLLLKAKIGSKALSTYQTSYNKNMIGDSTIRFTKFTDKYLKPTYLSWKELKRLAKECVVCFAGSDQIWNSSTMYVDPMYYLRFAPAEKRIAFAPSFGRDYIADYNKNKMGKWISEFAQISVREDSGVKLIKEISGRDAIHLVDPTLIVKGKTWKKEFNIKDRDENYILAYFLDKPTEKAQKAIAELKAELGCKVIAIPYMFDDMSYCDEVLPTGPIEFLDLINNAKCVLTDSFHGTIFSINFHIPFYIFSRAYGTAPSQNSRIESILKIMNMQDRFEPTNAATNLSSLDFEYSESVLTSERQKARGYIRNILSTSK